MWRLAIFWNFRNSAKTSPFQICLSWWIQQRESQMKHPQLLLKNIEGYSRLGWEKNGKKANSILITDEKRRKSLKCCKDQNRRINLTKVMWGAILAMDWLSWGINSSSLWRDEHKFKVGQNIDIETLVTVVTEEEVFDVLWETHKQLLHGRRQ